VPAERELLDRLRDGDEEAFVELVDRYHTPMVRLAMTFVPSRAVAEEVAQDAWLGVLRGIERFEERAALKTWLFRILVNRARTTGARERRSVPVAEAEPAVDPARFGAGGAWASPPSPWPEDVDERLSAEQMGAKIRAAVAQLPARSRQVVLLRDIEGLASSEVCELLGISEANQRVLLHRGRERVRESLEPELGAVSA
jgi:RNA polymerase sigma-70 factor, ECF subfamily